MTSTAFVKPKRSCLMITLRWLLYLIISIPIVVYATFLIFFYVQQRNMLFPGQHRPVQIPTVESAGVSGLQIIRFDTLQGKDEGFAWYLPPLANPGIKTPAVIFSHGNGEIADDWVRDADKLRDRGYAILILGYPGFGHAPGSPSKDAIIGSALNAYDWLVAQPEINPDQIILFGHSLGGAVTLAIADQRPTKGAVLLSAFASIDHIARDRYLPPFLAKDRFDNLAIIENYDRPVFMMHGTEDIVVAPYQADLLHDAAPQSRLRWLTCGHGGCIGDIDEFWRMLDPIMQAMIRDS